MTDDRNTMHEFECNDCRETFVVSGPIGNEDDSHWVKENGEECGGIGTEMGFWQSPRPRIPKNARRPKHL